MKLITYTALQISGDFFRGPTSSSPGWDLSPGASHSIPLIFVISWRLDIVSALPWVSFLLPFGQGPQSENFLLSP